MAIKLTARQQAQLAFLDGQLPKIQRIQALIERMASPSEAESAGRSVARMLDEFKSGAAGLGLSEVAQTAGIMAGLARRTGGLQTRLRGLREGFAGLKINYDGARKAASTPERAEGAGPAEGT
jgi:hypothetical protein